MNDTAGRIINLLSMSLLAFSSIGAGNAFSAEANPTPESPWDSTVKTDWPPPFEKVEIPSSLNESPQSAFVFRSTAEKPMPLVVSLHTWSGDYSQKDALASRVMRKNWNYIHPDFRGANKNPRACASRLALQDIDDAIDYALKHFPVDPSRIFVVGVSGGGHAACMNYLSTRHSINTTFAWVPITDLEAWYHQSRARKAGYADDVFASTGSSGDTLNSEEARRRSPLYAPLPERKTSPLRLFAGIDDGYKGSVPISHTLLFYNRLAAAWGTPEDLVPDSEIIALLARGKPLAPNPGRMIENSEVLYHKNFPLASVTIFQGGHVMLVDYCMEEMEKAASHRP